MSNHPNGRPAAQIDAEVAARMDLLPAIARCCFCPDFVHEGSAIECRLASARHRERYHPQYHVRTRRRRGPVSRYNPGYESDRLAGEANAKSVAVMLAQRSASEAA